jgi:hypothetical protein
MKFTATHVTVIVCALVYGFINYPRDISPVDNITPRIQAPALTPLGNAYVSQAKQIFKVISEQVKVGNIKTEQQEFEELDKRFRTMRETVWKPVKEFQDTQYYDPINKASRWSPELAVRVNESLAGAK